MKKISLSIFVKYLIIFIGILFSANVIATIGINLFIKIGDIDLPPDLVTRMNPLTLTVALRMGVVSVSVGAIFILIATKIVVKPVKAISDASKKIASGDLQARVVYRFRTKNEVSKLAENFNKIANELSRNEYLNQDFVSNVSHEFKTPIAAIQGYAEMLTSPNISEKKRIEYGHIIVRQTARLAKLSSNLLRLSELENESMLIKKSTFSLSEQIRDAVVLLQNEWEEKNINIELDLEEISYTGDKALLYQVWVNIIGNAIKFTGNESKVSITLSKAERIMVKISDNGIGMTEEQVSRVFERFYKADESHTSSSTGLGLSIAKRIVELHSGEIKVKSAYNEGSCFEIIL